MSTAEILGAWCAVAMTLFIFSFLYKDNPFYRLAEHIFIGLTVGYSIVVAIWDGLLPNWWKPLTGKGEWSLLVPAILGVLALCRLVPRIAWLSRWAFAFIMGYYAGIAIPTSINAFILPQIETTVTPVVARPFDEDEQTKLNEKVQGMVQSLEGAIEAHEKMNEAYEKEQASKPINEDELRRRKVILNNSKENIELRHNQLIKTGPYATWQIAELEKKSSHPVLKAHLRKVLEEIPTNSAWKAISDLLILVIVIAVLFYFFFSIEHRGPVKVAARGGILFLMAAFGIAYGNTVMGRMALLFGRVYDLRDYSAQKYYYATPIVLGVTVLGLVVWEIWRRLARPAREG